jgi:hypothetical protein
MFLSYRIVNHLCKSFFTRRDFYIAEGIMPRRIYGDADEGHRIQLTGALLLQPNRTMKRQNIKPQRPVILLENNP